MQRVMNWIRRAWDRVRWWLFGTVPEKPLADVPQIVEPSPPGETVEVPWSFDSPGVVDVQAFVPPSGAVAYVGGVPFLSLKQVSVLTQLRIPQVKSMVRDGTFEGWRRGRRWMIWSASVLDWLS